MTKVESLLHNSCDQNTGEWNYTLLRNRCVHRNWLKLFCSQVSSTDNMVGHVLILLFCSSSTFPWTTADFEKKKKIKSLGFFLFPKEEILKVANHSLETLTKQMGFDTSGLILNANMSIYALAQVLLSPNLFWGCLIFFFFLSFVLRTQLFLQ